MYCCQCDAKVSVYILWVCGDNRMIFKTCLNLVPLSYFCFDWRATYPKTWFDLNPSMDKFTFTGNCGMRLLIQRWCLRMVIVISSHFIIDLIINPCWDKGCSMLVKGGLVILHDSQTGINPTREHCLSHQHDAIYQYCIEHVTFGLLYVMFRFSISIFCKGVPGFATDRLCGIWCHGLTLSSCKLIHFSEINFEMIVGL